MLTVIFENGECADYSFQNKIVSESYKVFESGIIYPEKISNYFLISYKNNLGDTIKDNIISGLNFNIKTHTSEYFADHILVYGKSQANSDWKKVTDNYDDKSSAYPYKDGFLIFQVENCIYYDVKKGAVIWENQDINHIDDTERKILVKKAIWMQDKNIYEYLGTDSSGQSILVGTFYEDFSYKIHYLNGKDGKTVKTDCLNLESYNDTPYKAVKISDFQKSNGKIHFSLKLEGVHGIIISYDLASGESHCKSIELKKSSSSIKISSVSHSGQYILWCEQNENTLYLDECYQTSILDMNNKQLHPLMLDKETQKNIFLLPNPCWSDDDEHFAFRSDEQILILSKTGDYEYAIEAKEYIFAAFGFFDNILYVIGELNGTPMLYRYSEKSGKLMDSSELKGRSGFSGNTFNIECIKTFDSELIMILHHNHLINDLIMRARMAVPFHNAYIIDLLTGKSIAFVKQGAAYNQNIDYLFADKGIVKRYTTDELIKKFN